MHVHTYKSLTYPIGIRSIYNQLINPAISYLPQQPRGLERKPTWKNPPLDVTPAPACGWPDDDDEQDFKFVPGCVQQFGLVALSDWFCISLTRSSSQQRTNRPHRWFEPFRMIVLILTRSLTYRRSPLCTSVSLRRYVSTLSQSIVYCLYHCYLLTRKSFIDRLGSQLHALCVQKDHLDSSLSMCML